MQVEDLWEMQRVGAPRLSPDGQWVVFSVSEHSMTRNTSNSDLWLVRSDGSNSPLTRSTFSCDDASR